MSISKILIVDDMEENIDILCDILKEYDLSMALSGADALEIIKTNKPDLILLDVVMPDMDGYEICKRIKDNSIYKNIPIIFLTAKSDQESVTKGFESGGVDYLVKPFNPKELQCRVDTHLHLSNLLHEQEKLICQQSKLASMGEIMDSVAHQWMQPLNLLKIHVGNLETDSFLGTPIDDEYIENYTKELYQYIDHMQNTLTEFRGFFRPNKIKSNFKIESTLNKAMVLLKNELIAYKIDMDIDIDDNFEIYGYENEFIHILLNLINNSKDAFECNNIDKKQIKIKTYIKDNNYILSYSDNAGGIPEHILDKIFDANITSKGDLNGTGMGMYMSQQIVQRHHGIITAKNIEDGANFTITIKGNN